MKKLFFVAVMFLLPLEIFSEKPGLLDIAKKELERNMQLLQDEETPPYFISYQITEIDEVSISGSFGKIKNISDNLSRILDIDLRVGGYKFDNTHIIRGNPFSFSARSGRTQLPLDDDTKSIRATLWYATDSEYKSAIERYEKAVTNSAVKVQEEDTSADFSREEPVKYIGEIKDFEVDKKAWMNKIRDLSAMFAGHDWLYEGHVSFATRIKNKYFVSTEGSEIVHSVPYCRVRVHAYTKAEDGMVLPLHKTYFAFSPDGLPGKSELAKDIEKLIKTLKELRDAPLMTTYSGPAILSGEAAGVFFHEIFGHRVEGHREKDPNSSQTFKNSIDEEILPGFIDVVFDPTERRRAGKALSGYYKYDDEGIEAQKVVTVDDGIFKKFLMSRSPIENFPKSNGHGRRQAGFKACSRQSNLIVEAEESMTDAELRERLRTMCIDQGKEYGLYFDVVAGGFTFTSRTIPNAFNVTPRVVYKIYADGRPDELVRGVDLIGTPLTTFANIVAASDEIGVFNGTCGAESGGVPVSSVSPSLLVSLIEVQRKSKSQAKPPILPAPEDIGRTEP
jgi:predicted Zn-dependent protease